MRVFAPLVHLHSRERYLPASASWLLERSTLEWKDACPEVNLAAGAVARRTTGEDAPRLVPRRLGKPPGYRQRARRGDCSTRRRAVYATVQHTRPGDVDRRPAGLRDFEGFNLDILLEAHGGERRPVVRGAQSVLEGVPAYFEQRPARASGRAGRRITYWLAYGAGEALGADGERVLAHEGDWERVEVLVRDGMRPDSYLPVALRHFVDGRPRSVPWHELELASGDRGPRTHPVLFAAEGSHTPYVAPGRHRRSCAACPQWRTWERLRSVKREPWYGYGGGWGVRGLSPETSGPLGPSPYLP